MPGPAQTSKHRTDPVLRNIVDRIKQGLTRTEAANELGISEGSLNNRLRRGGYLDELKPYKRSTFVENLKNAPNSNGAYDAAVALALQGHSNKAAHARFPELSYQVLCRKVREAQGWTSNPRELTMEKKLQAELSKTLSYIEDRFHSSTDTEKMRLIDSLNAIFKPVAPYPVEIP